MVHGKEFMKFKFLPAVVTRVDVSHNNNQENNERIYFLLSQSLLRKINDLNRY